MIAWELAIPLPTWGLNAERSMHWAEHAARTKEMRGLAYMLARSEKIPTLDRVAIEAWPVGSRNRQDVGAAFPSIKACIDGLVDARVIPKDTKGHVVRLTMLPPQTGDVAGLVLRIVDASEDDDAP